MKLASISPYLVKRQTDIGYMISDGGEEFFLHFNECCGRTLQINEEVQAFLYIDKMRRVAATLKIPFVTQEVGGLCEVVNTALAGVFVNIGLSRDVLLSSDDLTPGKWPQVGDKVCGKLYLRNKNIFFKLLNKQEILTLNKNVELNIDQRYKAYIYRLTDAGVNLVDENYNVIFIYYKNLRKIHHLGEEIVFRITHKNADDYSGTTIEQKENMIASDAEVIIEYLQTHFGVMSYTEETDAEIIFNVFKMSKASFKRALGHLYKEKKIGLQNNKTILLDYQ